MAFPRAAHALAGVLVLAALACGGGAPASPPRAVTDRAYLAVICAGLERFSDAVYTETEAAGIAAAIVAFIEDLQAVAPPADVASFHEAFIAYLEEAVDDPTRPLAIAPPLPDEEVRARLVEQERTVAECHEPTFLNTGPAER